MSKFNFVNLIKNAKRMESVMRDELQHLALSGEAGAGAVKVTMTGRHVITTLEIDDEILKEDKQVLIELIIAAINDATSKVEAAMREKMMDAGGMLDMDSLMEGLDENETK